MDRVKRKFEVVTDSCNGKDFIAALGEGKRVVDFAAMRFNSDEFQMSQGSYYTFGFLGPKDGISSTEVLAEIACLNGIVEAPVESALLALGVLTPDDFVRLKVRVILVMHKPVVDSDGYTDRMGVMVNGGALTLTTYDDGKEENVWPADVGFLFCISKVLYL